MSGFIEELPEYSHEQESFDRARDYEDDLADDQKLVSDLRTVLEFLQHGEIVSGPTATRVIERAVRRIERELPSMLRKQAE